MTGIHEAVQSSIWRFELREYGRLIDWQAQQNVLTENGMAELARRNVGASALTNTHAAVGTGATSELVSDTTLQTESARKPIANRLAVGPTERYTTEFQPVDFGTANLPLTITEAGLLTAAANGILMYRTTSEPMRMQIGRTLTLVVVITHKNGALL